MYIYCSTIYSNYNKPILHSNAETTKIKNMKNKGWFHFIRNFLFPLIEAIHALLSDYWTLQYWHRSLFIGKAMTKFFATGTVWYHRTWKSSMVWPSSRKIHSMHFNHKERGRVSVFFLKDSRAITPLPPSCRCVYPMGNWRRLVQKCFRTWRTLSQGL